MTTKIANVRVFTGTSFSDPSDVCVADTKILSILPTSSAPAHEADTPSVPHFLIPGLIDAHVHIATQTSLLPAARHGITTAVDMALFPDPPRALAALRAASPHLTDIRSAGIPATAPGTVHSRMPSMPAEALLETVEQAKAFVAKRVEQKADYVKVVADVPVGPSQEVLDVVVTEAHKAGKLVVAHAARMASFEMAIRSGADVLTHVPLDGVVSGEMAEEMRERGMICCPTLVMMKGMSKVVPRAEYRCSREGVGVLKEGVGVLKEGVGVLKEGVGVLKEGVGVLKEGVGVLKEGVGVLKEGVGVLKEGVGVLKEGVGVLKEGVGVLKEAGVVILAGTDANDGKMCPVPLGSGIHEELALLVEAGLSNQEALWAATEGPAKVFSLEDRGKIEVGLRADLVLLGSNPLDDIVSSKDILGVWCAGHAVDLS